MLLYLSAESGQRRRAGEMCLAGGGEIISASLEPGKVQVCGGVAGDTCSIQSALPFTMQHGQHVSALAGGGGVARSCQLETPCPSPSPLCFLPPPQSLFFLGPLFSHLQWNSSSSSGLPVIEACFVFRLFII